MMYLSSQFKSILKHARAFSSEERPLKVVWDKIMSDFADIGNKFGKMDNADFYTKDRYKKFPPFADVVIIGGGTMGSAAAYWLKERARDGVDVVVIEKDLKFSQSSLFHSRQGLRQQYSLPENILMSIFGADFLRNSKRNLGDDVDLKYFPRGNLILADKFIAETLEQNIKMQKEHGVHTTKLTASKIKEKFPWIKTDDVEFGCIGKENEGWFDPWALLWGLKRRAVERGAMYFNAELVDVVFKNRQDVLMEGCLPGTYSFIDKLLVRHRGEMKELDFTVCVIAAGEDSKSIANLANIGKGDGILSFDLPIESRKRSLYFFEDVNRSIPELCTPLVNDVSGLWFDREGTSNVFVAERPYVKNNNYPNYDNNTDYFYNEVLPCIQHRVPSFKDIKLGKEISGFYDYNAFDENGILGYHPYHDNIIIASGFSGQGLQQIPAIGKAISELVYEGAYITVDLTRLGFDRLITNTPQYETNMI